MSVIGHEFETFKVEFEKMGGAPPRLTEVYMNPYWHRFNEGLPYQAFREVHWPQGPGYPAAQSGRLPEPGTGLYCVPS
jgi:hypothetical protein